MYYVLRSKQTGLYIRKPDHVDEFDYKCKFTGKLNGDPDLFPALFTKDDIAGRDSQERIDYICMESQVKRNDIEIFELQVTSEKPFRGEIE